MNTNKIRQSQIEAGEKAVIDGLKAKGFFAGYSENKPEPSTMTPIEAADIAFPPLKNKGPMGTYHQWGNKGFIQGADWQASQSGQARGMKWIKASEPLSESRWPTEGEIEQEAILLYPTVDEEKNPNVNRIIGFERAAFKAAIQWLQTSGVREGTERELKERLRELVEGYESWEAELISDNRCWGPEGMNSYPTLTSELYDKMMELQGKRNEAKKLLSKTI